MHLLLIMWAAPFLNGSFQSRALAFRTILKAESRMISVQISQYSYIPYTIQGPVGKEGHHQKCSECSLRLSIPHKKIQTRYIMEIINTVINIIKHDIRRGYAPGTT